MDNKIKMVDNDSIVLEHDEIMTEEDAIQLTETIKSTFTATCILLQQAHDQKAWKAMGYDSWKAYIDKEFSFSRARSYQLLEQGKIIQTLNEAGDTTDLFLTEKEAKSIKNELPRITKKIEDATTDKTPEEREEISNDLVKKEIEKAMKEDKDDYDESKDFDSMVAEDGGNTERDNFVGASKNDVWGPTEEEEPAPVESSNFYIGNLERTLSIMENFPKASELLSTVELEEDKKIALRNRIKYSMTWLESFLNEIE